MEPMTREQWEQVERLAEREGWYIPKDQGLSTDTGAILGRALSLKAEVVRAQI